MGKYIKSVIFIIIILVIASGCSKKQETFKIPENYTAKVNLKIYTAETENDYDVELTCKDKIYSFKINDDKSSWNIAMSGDTCLLSNEKFTDGSVKINDFKLKDTLVNEFELSKFNVSEDPMPKELVYYDGVYKHVLKFSNENLLPESIFIYKKDDLVKTIHYEKINME